MKKLKVGDTFQFSITITKKLHNDFSKLSGDKSPRHLKGMGYGFLLTALLSRLYGMLPNSICLKQEANFIKPFYVGDYITLEGIITYKSKSTKLVEIETVICCKKKCIFRGRGIVKII